MSETKSEDSAASKASLEPVVMRDGYLPDFEGKPVLASCTNCTWSMDQSDGPEYGPSWYACEKEGKEHMTNLKGFPFKTAQKCCELHIAFTVDWAAEAKKSEKPRIEHEL